MREMQLGDDARVTLCFTENIEIRHHTNDPSLGCTGLDESLHCTVPLTCYAK